MTAKTITLELPEDLVALLGPPDTISVRAREALVLQLLREAQISQGRAARLLGLTRGDMLRVMAEQRIFSGPETAEEAERDVEAARKGALSAARDAGD
jgi:predicted HTH domain antitoxin